MTETNRIVAVTPSSLFEEGSGHFVKLRHPRFDDGSCFYFRTSDNSIWEVQRFNEKFRSWFIGNSVKSDGSLYFLTPFDPLFMAIQYLKKKSRFSTLDTILEDSEFPEVKHLADSEQLTTRIELIAEVKSSSGFKAMRFSKSKTLEWLERKFHKVEKVLKDKEVSCHSEGTAQASNWRSDESSDPEAVRQYALGLLSEYLPEDLSDELAERLGIQIDHEAPAPVSKKREQDENGTGDSENGPPKKRKSVAPSDDYQENFRQLVDLKKDATEKAAKPKLKKEQGMQSITNFFRKK